MREKKKTTYHRYHELTLVKDIISTVGLKPFQS